MVRAGPRALRGGRPDAGPPRWAAGGAAPAVVPYRARPMSVMTRAGRDLHLGMDPRVYKLQLSAPWYSVLRL